jgi:uncharacterized protein (DUF488 family)
VLLRRHGIGLVADVRAYPTSRRVPDASREALERWLPEEGIAYAHMPELGGRRRARAGSAENAGWQSEGFRAYADHMRTDEFLGALERLEAAARERPTAVMCAEGLWWRCHRRLISDALLVRGWAVRHILPDGELAEHELPEFALVEGGELSYPPLQGTLDA